MDNQTALKHQELAFCLPKQPSTRGETLGPELSIEFSVVLTAEIRQIGSLFLFFCWLGFVLFLCSLAGANAAHLVSY